MAITLMEWMEDFDNSELSEHEWQEQLEDAVRVYNEENGTNHNPYYSFVEYTVWLKNN